MNDLEHRIKALIVESLNLEDISPEDIDSEAPLFVEGLGLDSIDALELGIALKNEFSVTLDAESTETKRHFHSVRNLADFVAQQQGS